MLQAVLARCTMVVKPISCEWSLGEASWMLLLDELVRTTLHLRRLLERRRGAAGDWLACPLVAEEQEELAVGSLLW